jgi:hypothetical protein
VCLDFKLTNKNPRLEAVGQISLATNFKLAEIEKLLGK